MPTQLSDEAVDARIDEFVERSKELTGKAVKERTPWNHGATADAIRHFAHGISDDNPLWLDADYAADTAYGRRVAPPTFLTSVLYPILHGAPMDAPLASLIGGVEYRWLGPILEGDSLRAESVQKDLFEKESGSGRRLIFVISEVTYRNQRDEEVASATGTMIRSTQVGDELLVERPIHEYSDDEIEAIGRAQEREPRRGSEVLRGGDVEVGDELPTLVRGPLTIGDMICWQAGIGPSYRAGSLGYRDCLDSPHSAVEIPGIGWPVKNSQQHEDPRLAGQRGMPGPFDNGVMRFAWVSPLLTNWMGDEGVLAKLYVRIGAPVLYGDTVWYRGTVTEKTEEEEGTTVTVEIAGVNQVGETVSTGEAEVRLP